MTEFKDGTYNVTRRFTWEDLDRLVQHYASQMTPEALSYLESRGISEETAEQYRLGFESVKIGFQADAPGMISGFFQNCIVFPITDTHGKVLDLVGRAIDNREPKYRSLLGRGDAFFNQPVLSQTDDVILVRNVFDVLSLAQERLPAVSLPDLSPFTETHAELLRGKRVFICYPNDDSGQRESLRTAGLLESTAAAVYLVQLPQGLRDVNDLFMRINDATDVFMNLLNEAVSENLKLPVFPDVRSVTAFMEEYAKRQRGILKGISTGFPDLDTKLVGGLHTGLYLLAGGVSSGKSLLLRQLADAIAGGGSPVVFVSWEMTPYELWCRSMARLLQVPPQDVLSGAIPVDQMGKAMQTYATTAKHMWTIEGRLEVTLQDVESIIARVIQSIGRTPVVFVDDLCRVPLYDSSGRLVQNNPTMAALHLHQWSRQWSTPVVAAMPLGRTEEVQPVTEAAADAIIHLDTGGAHARPGNPQQAVLRLLKNRNGPLGSIPLWFDREKAQFSSSHP